jgi:hypothetical protein
MTTHHTFRQSFLNEFLICPERARLSLTDNKPPDNTDAAACGTAVHAGIEHVLLGGGFLGAMDAIEDAWWDEQREAHFRWTKYSGNTAWKWIETCWDHWCTWYQKQHYLHDLPWACEVPFEVRVYEDAERTISIKGTIDAWDGTRVWDWKTSSRGEYEAREYQRWAIQPTVYTRAMTSLHSQHNVPFKYGIMHAKGMQTFQVDRDERDWAWLNRKCVSIAKLIEADLDQWPLTDDHWLCSEKWCVNWANCKGQDFPTEG